MVVVLGTKAISESAAVDGPDQDHAGEEGDDDIPRQALGRPPRALVADLLGHGEICLQTAATESSKFGTAHSITPNAQKFFFF